MNILRTRRRRRGRMSIRRENTSGGGVCGWFISAGKMYNGHLRFRLRNTHNIIIFSIHKYYVPTTYTHLFVRISLCLYLYFIISFWFVSFHFVARLVWNIFLFLLFFPFRRELLRMVGCISRARSHAHTHVRQSYCIFHVISYIQYLHEHAESIYLTRLSLDLCACASFSCILFITHRLFFDFRCLTAQSAYATHCVCLLCCAVWWHSTVANTNTNISNAWQLSIFGIMIESGNKNTKCVRRAFAWTIS